MIGENGSGKSTLAAFIAGHQREQYTITGEEQRYEANPIPIITQTTSEYLIGATPYEDLMISVEQFGTSDINVQDSIAKVAKDLQIEHLLHKAIERLSGGEKQLVAIAGSLLMRSKLLIIDEITSMLSEQAKELVISRIRTFCKKHSIAVLWITQQLDELQSEDTIWVMRDLTMIYSGSAQQLYEGNKGATRADQLQLPIPWSIQKQQRLTIEGYSFEKPIFNIKQLAQEVRQYASTTAR